MKKKKNYIDFICKTQDLLKDTKLRFNFKILFIILLYKYTYYFLHHIHKAEANLIA